MIQLRKLDAFPKKFVWHMAKTLFNYGIIDSKMKI